MDIRQLEAVLAVARHRNFTRAAESQGLTQSAISAQVRNLEAELGLRLFERTTRRVLLTDVGAVFVDRADRILSQISALSTEMQRREHPTRGLVKLGAWFSVNPGLAEVLADFVQLNPDIDMIIREAPSPQMLQMIRASELDAAFITLTDGMDLAGIEHHVYVEEPFVLLVPPKSKLAALRSVSFQDLEGTPLIMPTAGSANRRVFEDALMAHGLTARIVVETNETATARQLVSRGIGAAIQPECIAHAAGPRVHAVSFVPPLMRVSAMIWRKGPVDRILRTFMGHVLKDPDRITRPRWDTPFGPSAADRNPVPGGPVSPEPSNVSRPRSRSRTGSRPRHPRR